MHNKNQLLMDLRAAQHQRRALGLPSRIIWGATCSKGQFEVFSSEWEDNVRFRLLLNDLVTDCFSVYLVFLTSRLEFAQTRRIRKVLFIPS